VLQILNEKIKGDGLVGTNSDFSGIAMSLAIATVLICPVALHAEEMLVKDGQKIAFMGDSITDQGARSPNGYVCLVISGLEANGIKVTPFPVGISGQKSNDMLSRIGCDVLSKKPDWMTLSCGVNDVWHQDFGKGIPLDKYKENITKIVDMCQAAGIKVMLLTSTMIGEDQVNSKNQKLIEYNEFIRNLAKEKNCPLADLNANMQAELTKMGSDLSKPGRVLTADGVHMNPDGNLMMATGILKTFGLSEEQIQKAKNKWAYRPEPGKGEKSDKVFNMDFNGNIDAVDAYGRKTEAQGIFKTAEFAEGVKEKGIIPSVPLYYYMPEEFSFDSGTVLLWLKADDFLTAERIAEVKRAEYRNVMCPLTFSFKEIQEDKKINNIEWGLCFRTDMDKKSLTLETMIGGAFIQQDVTSLVKPGTWFSLAFKWEKSPDAKTSKVKAYMDGILIAEKNGICYAGKDMKRDRIIVGVSTNGAQSWRGTIDELTVWDHALPDEEIAKFAKGK